jgi:type I restriction enzyme M protein
MVPMSEIADPKNDFNLNIARYIDSSEPEDLQDLNAHIHGGIPERDIDALSGYWDAFPSLRATLFTANRPGYSNLAVDVATVQQTVLDSIEFKNFAADISNKVSEWFSNHRGGLTSIGATTRPNELITSLGDDLLARFTPVPLLDEYDIYEQLMTYWDDVLHDDVFLLMNDGWIGAGRPRKAIEDKDRKLVETPDLVVGTGRSATKYKVDLIPPQLITARYLADSEAKVEELNVEAEEATRVVDEYTGEHAVEDGLLSGAIEDDKINKALASARLREARREGGDPDEVKALEHVITLYAAETAAKKAAKDSRAALDLATLKKYGELSADDVMELVLDDKWHAAIASRIAGEVNSLTLELVQRVQQLAERYDETVDDLDAEVAKLNLVVAEHLTEMGFTK